MEQQQHNRSNFPDILTDYIVCSVAQKSVVQPKLDPGIKDEPLFDEFDNKVYLFNISVDPNDKYAALSTSLNQIKLYDIEKRSLIFSYSGHKDKITSVQFYNESMIYSSSNDGSIIFWDTRTDKPQKIIQAKSSLFSSAANENIISGGGHSFISNWDIRHDNNKVISSFNDSHYDDITNLKYHPITNYLFSSSCDGLTCIFDVTQNTEDDAIIDVFNIGQSINKIGFAGNESEFLYVLLHTEQMQLWNIPNASKVNDYGIDFRENLQQNIVPSEPYIDKVEVNYLIDCKYHMNELFLFCGSFDGKVSVFSLNDHSINYVSTLKHGHSSIVRDIHSNFNKNYIISIGEDSRMAFWNENGSFKGSYNNTHRSSNQKNKQSSSSSSSNHGYHPYQ